MSTVFAWHERGSAFVARTEPGRGLIVEAHGEISGTRVELPEVAVHELREALGETFGDPQRAELLEAVHATEQQLGDVEQERDGLVDRVTQLEAELRARLGDLEAARTALDLADRRARFAEHRDLGGVRR